MQANHYAFVWKASSSSINKVVSLINFPLIAQVLPQDEMQRPQTG